MDVAEREALLRSLDFGRVDAESESDLDRRFVRTADFDRFVEPETQIVLGAKGTGKSAIFDLFARFEESARAQAGRQIAGHSDDSGRGGDRVQRAGRRGCASRRR